MAIHKRKPLLKRECPYCKEDDRRTILCRSGSAVKIIPYMRMAIVMHEYFSDQFDLKYCPKCGRKL